MAEKKKKPVKKKVTGAKKKKKSASAPKKKAAPGKSVKPAMVPSAEVSAPEVPSPETPAPAPEALDVSPQGADRDMSGHDELETPLIESPVSGQSDMVLDDSFIDELIRQDEAEGENDASDYLLFRVGAEGYSLRVSDVKEILRHQSITRVPRCAAHVVGATSLRGAILPVIDLCSLMSGSDSTEVKSGRILVLGDTQVMVGVLVEKKIGMRGVGDDRILPPPAHASVSGEEYVRGALDIDGEFYALLDPEAICRTRATGRIDEK